MKEATKEGRKDGRTEKRKDERTEYRKDEREEARKHERKSRKPVAPRVSLYIIQNKSMILTGKYIGILDERRKNKRRGCGEEGEVRKASRKDGGKEEQKYMT
jgi:hypothetical protein